MFKVNNKSKQPMNDQCFLAVPPEYIRELLVFWYFQGDWMGNIGLKFVNSSWQEIYIPTSNFLNSLL